MEVLGNSKEILKMTEAVEKLEDIEDSKMLGDLMIANGLIIKMRQKMAEEDGAPSAGGCCGGSGPSAKKQKWPEIIEVNNHCSSMEEGEIYMIVEEEFNSTLACFYIGIALFFTLALISIPVWPKWLYNLVVFNVGLKLAFPVGGFLLARLLLWYVPFHLGVSLWILPNIFYLKNVASPIVEMEVYNDFLEPFSLFLRVLSAGITSLVSYKGYEYIL